jgi:hypothetical protein
VLATLATAAGGHNALAKHRQICTVCTTDHGLHQHFSHFSLPLFLASNSELYVTLTVAASTSNKNKMSGECHVFQEEWNSFYLY